VTLDEWVKRKGRGELSRLMRATGLAYTTILDARREGVVGIDTAQRISDATDGAVTVDELKREEPARPKASGE
jgi:hypothetical protein